MLGKRVQVDQDSQSVLCKFDDIAVYIAKEKMVRILRAERFIKQGKRSKIEYNNPIDLSSEVQNITLIGSPFSPSINTTTNFSEDIVLTMKWDITEAPLAKYIVKVKLEYNTEDKNYILKQEEGKIIQQFLNRLSNLSTSARCIPPGIPHRDTHQSLNDSGRHVTVVQHNGLRRSSRVRIRELLKKERFKHI